MTEYFFDGKTYKDRQGNPKKNPDGSIKQDPGFIIKSEDGKTTLRWVNIIRSKNGLTPIEDETTCPQGVDLSGSYGSHMVVWDGKEFSIVSYDKALKSPPRGPGSGSDMSNPQTAISPELPPPIKKAGTGKASKNKPNNTKPMKGTEILIAVSEIKQSDAFLCREQNCPETIDRYAGVFKEYKEAEKRGKDIPYPFPPILVRRDANGYTQITGYHRRDAALKSGVDRILVKLFEGTDQEAIWTAMIDNRHGLRLNSGDLKHCIIKALTLLPDKSHGMIAEGLGCTQQYVSKIASQVTTGCDVTDAKKKQGRDGKKYSTTRKTDPKKKSDTQTAKEKTGGEQATTAKPTKSKKDSGAKSASSADDATPPETTEEEPETRSDSGEGSEDGGLECELARIIQSLDDLKLKYPEEQDHNFITEEIFTWLYSDSAAKKVLGEFAEKTGIGNTN